MRCAHRRTASLTACPPALRPSERRTSNVRHARRAWRTAARATVAPYQRRTARRRAKYAGLRRARLAASRAAHRPRATSRSQAQRRRAAVARSSSSATAVRACRSVNHARQPRRRRRQPQVARDLMAPQRSERRSLCSRRHTESVRARHLPSGAKQGSHALPGTSCGTGRVRGRNAGALHTHELCRGAATPQTTRRSRAVAARAARRASAAPCPRATTLRAPPRTQRAARPPRRGPTAPWRDGGSAAQATHRTRCTRRASCTMP